MSQYERGSMEKKDEAQDPSPQDQQRVLLDLIYSVKTLAGNVEVMHQDLRKVLEEESRVRDRELDRLRDLATKNSQLLQVLPITTADRLDRLIDRKVDGVLEDVRLSIQEVREKLWRYISNKDAQSALPTQIDDSSGDITSLEIKKDAVHFKIKTDGLEKAWKILRWVVAAIAAGGGGWALIKSLFKS